MPAARVGPRLGRGEDSTLKLWAVRSPGRSHRSQLVLPQSFSPFFPMLSKEKSPTKGHTMQQPKQFHLEFKWSAPLDPLMTTSNLLGVASDESEDGLSREHSLGSDDQLLFSDTESVPSSNEGSATPKKTAFGEDEEWEVVPCSQPDDDEHLDDHHPSATNQRADATMDAAPELNAVGRPKREAAKGVSAYLQLARESLSSRACLYFGPRGPRTERQRRALQQTAKRVEDAQARKLETQAPITKDPGAQSCTQPALTPVEQSLNPRFRSDFRHLPLRFLEGKGRKMSAVDRAAVRVLKGEITLEKVGRHRVTKGAVKSRLTRLKNGVQKTGQKPALAMEIEQQLATYIDDHTAAGMCRYREEVWDHAEDLARRASLKWSATWGWWRRFKGRWPSVVTRWKEAVKLERLYAENPESVERWFNRYKQFLSDKGIEDPEQIVIIDEAGTFIGYGNRRRVVASKGKAASRGEREEREWISVLAGGTAGGTQLPPTYLYSQTHVSGSDSA